MNAQKFIGDLKNLSHLIARTPHLLYAKRETINGVPSVTLAFNTEPKMHIEPFDSEATCNLWWGEFVTLMSEQCTPPCISVGSSIFQRLYLQRIVCHSNEQAHFVILDFGNDRNMWLGYNAKKMQLVIYQALIQVLSPHLLPPDTSRKTH